LLEQANDPGKDPDARRGLRYLLHGYAEHQFDDQSTLWIPAHDQHSAWPKLWGQLYGKNQWSLVSSDLADVLTRGVWAQAGIREIQAINLLDDLRKTGRGIPAADAFDIEERNEILSKIDDQGLWLRLPLHTTVSGVPISATGDRIYLAPVDDRRDDRLIHEATLIQFSLHPVVADKQRKWLKPFDERAILDLALDADEALPYWSSIMDALARVQLSVITDSGLLKKLRERAWLQPATDLRLHLKMSSI
jgi:hypothetical protein